MEQYLLLSDKPPNRRMLRRGAEFIRYGQYLAAFSITLLVLLDVHNVETLFLVIGWGVLFSFYLLARQYLTRKKHWLLKEKAVIYHGIVGIVGVFITYLLFRAAGYGHGTTDPVGYWMLAIIPLALVSRYGSTRQWFLLLILALLLQITSRLWTVLVIDRIDLDLNQLLNLLTPIFAQAFMLIAFSGGIHYAFRYRRMNLIRSKVVTEVSHRLASEVLPEKGYTRAAEAIQKLDQFPDDYFPFVSIMKWDGEDARLKVVGGAGFPKEEWHCVEVEAGQGITGRVFVTGEPILEPDVRKISPDDYHCPKGFEDIRSELAVPIKYQSGTLGVLDVQSPRLDEFDDSDKEMLNTLASGLGIAFYSTYLMDEKTSNAYQLLQETLDAGDSIEISSWFQDIAQACCKYLSADRLFFFRLAPGTYYPVRPTLIWPKISNLSKKNYRDIPDNSIFWKLIHKWEAVFGLETVLDYYALANEQWARPLLESLSISSIAFIPIGTYERLGALFVCYKSPKTYSDIDKFALLAFSAALERSYRQLHPDRLEEDHRGSTVHDILIPETMGIFGKLEQVNSYINEPEKIREYVIAAKERISSLRKRVTLAIAGMENRYIPYEDTLQTALYKVASELNANRGKRVAFQIHVADRIEDEDGKILLLLFRLSSEAMGNAVQHGNAQVVKVNIERTEQSIEFQVTDDGMGLQPDHVKHRPHGIYYWKDFLREEYGVILHLENQQRGGTKLSFTLPCCPIFAK